VRVASQEVANLSSARHDSGAILFCKIKMDSLNCDHEPLGVDKSTILFSNSVQLRREVRKVCQQSKDDPTTYLCPYYTHDDKDPKPIRLCDNHPQKSVCRRIDAK
jgi:hypothetical protein